MIKVREPTNYFTCIRCLLYSRQSDEEDKSDDFLQLLSDSLRYTITASVHKEMYTYAKSTNILIVFLIVYFSFSFKYR